MDQVPTDRQPTSVDNLLQETRRFPPKSEFAKKAYVQSFTDYEQMYRRSIADSDAFWLEQAETLDWIQKPTVACKYTWDTAARNIHHTWFEDGSLNVTLNCLDRHLTTDKRTKTAILWQGEEEEDTLSFTYEELHQEVCRCANALKSLGVEKGDRVCLYLPMIPELTISMLACARIGAIHSIVFGGFSSQALRDRINDSTCKVLITTDLSHRGGKPIHFKQIVDEALEDTPSIEKVLVVQKSQEACSMKSGRDLWYKEVTSQASAQCPAEPMQAEDPLFILYTSGSTGKPKGVVHTTAGYLLHAALSHKMIFDVHDDDVYWCTADIGWITGHSYIVYGPLANGATSLMFEGVPTYPDAGRFWQIIDKYHVSVFYTAPTAIRALIRLGDSWPNQYKLDSLRVLGTVGEPINPEAWMWYYKVIGKEQCPIVDTWWQTETGGIMITPLPGAHTLKPGCASRPFFGVDPVILRHDSTTCQPNEGGDLCIRRPWPGMMRTMWGDHERFIDTYFSAQPNFYFTGDGSRQDEEGDFWILGRIDDVVNVSGHRIGTAEVESALVSHKAVSEAAVVPMPHDIKGQALYAFVTLTQAAHDGDLESMQKDLRLHVRSEIGPIATPDRFQFTDSLPKTRSGKIMRRILRKIAENDTDNLGDTSTLADPSVVTALVQGRSQS